jgi:hypothetical protein
MGRVKEKLLCEVCSEQIARHNVTITDLAGTVQDSARVCRDCALDIPYLTVPPLTIQEQPNER